MVYITNLSDHVDEEVTLKGWVYNYRSSKNLYFLELRDGSGICQCVVARDAVSEEVWNSADTLRQESSLEVIGIVVEDERSIGGYELQVTDIKVIQVAEDYPITPKEHGVDFLMENRHLWLRSRRQWAAMRVRNAIIYAIHTFFQERGFVQMDAPIFTGNAAEGTTNLFETEYFDEEAYLTQSGQLYGEAMAMAHGLIYTFGPTFRAEKSKTRRHLTEFWMIEPEMAFYDLDMNIDLAENFTKFVIKKVLERCENELEILERDTTTLKKTVEESFPRISYTEAVERLKSDEMADMLDQMVEDRKQEKTELKEEQDEIEKERGQAKKWRKAQIDQRIKEIGARIDQIEEDLRNIPDWRESALNFTWGEDFGGSDETLLTMQYDTPIFVHRYPAEIKAFYMKRDPEDENLALAVDMLAPEGYGEVIGGSEREADLDTLKKRLAEHDLPEDVFQWYLDLRQYGTVPHSGFGLGLERTVSWLCGLDHVRETIPFPRMMGRLTP
ncbi:OB-fold nucleic acid binding domain-containing protein [Aliifodinibius salicampi]|uniref:Asparagine--tRNA ligase n=1 Tax=Fodinibius salicampi TaxID=1920655 RepID=A0ABT3PWQ7_9BACT|nr:amino acid--tRNA ligase-related protein [Fodinibius salicampi]MCW9712282.1 OB-fold nucleic acid binding domain-containing protein [Fodinibius salicampi]